MERPRLVKVAAPVTARRRSAADSTTGLALRPRAAARGCTILIARSAAAPQNQFAARSQPPRPRWVTLHRGVYCLSVVAHPVHRPCTTSATPPTCSPLQLVDDTAAPGGGNEHESPRSGQM